MNENKIYDDYINSITKIGRITILLGMLATLAPALLMTFYFKYKLEYLVMLFITRKNLNGCKVQDCTL